MCVASILLTIGHLPDLEDSPMAFGRNYGTDAPLGRLWLACCGLDTPEVESLTSYFCRLAYSHGIKARDLVAWILKHFGQPIPDDYKW